MTVATALVTGNEPLPRLAEEAVQQALTRSGLSHANGVLLFLSPEFARHAQATVTAAARTAQCVQIAGGLASGVFTESAWALDRPAAAAMVFGEGFSLAHIDSGAPNNTPLLSYAGGNFPPHWSEGDKRFGGLFSGSFTGSASHGEAMAWQQSRITESGNCSMQILGADIAIAVSSGLRLLAPPQRITACNGFDLETLDGRSAAYSLRRTLPQALQTQDWPLMHQLTAVLLQPECSSADRLSEGHYRSLAIIAVNADQSVTLSDHVAPGQHLSWAIRQPDAAEIDMQQSLDRLTPGANPAACALMFSCIGRGPYFYGGDDRDLAALRQRYPGLPILGCYGTGQIAPAGCGTCAINRPLQNAVLTTLVSRRLEKPYV